MIEISKELLSEVLDYDVDKYTIVSSTETIQNMNLGAQRKFLKKLIQKLAKIIDWLEKKYVEYLKL